MNLWEPYNLFLLWEKTYVGLYLHKYTYKSSFFLFYNKDKLFNIFKLWVSYIKEANKNKLRYLLLDSKEKFISAALKSFYNKKSIFISNAASYIYEKKNSQIILKDFDYNKRLTTY